MSEVLPFRLSQPAGQEDPKGVRLGVELLRLRSFRRGQGLAPVVGTYQYIQFVIPGSFLLCNKMNDQSCFITLWGHLRRELGKDDSRWWWRERLRLRDRAGRSGAD